MASLGPIVTALWRELGLAPPPGSVGTVFDLELGLVPMRLELADNGDTVLVRGRIGFLEGNVHEAGDQLGRVLRLGLGLAALNGAVLDAAAAEDILDQDHQGPVPVHAIAIASLSAPSSILSAVRAVLDWQIATEQLLTQSEDGATVASTRAAPAAKPGDTEMIIFQP
jgi:hypothetical protein